MYSNPNPRRVCPDCGGHKAVASLSCRACRHVRDRLSCEPIATPDGYLRITTPDGRRIRHHRWVMEQAIGRPLLPTEHVHHKNGDKADNRPENLEILSHGGHMRIHARHDWDGIAALYRSGLSCNQIAGQLGIRTGSVRHVIEALGITRSRSEAMKLRRRGETGTFLAASKRAA